VLDEEPASSFFNWLHYRAYKWFRWLDERMQDQATEADFTIKAPAPAAAADDGGELLLLGGVSGANADKLGGDAILRGGDARGTGSSAAKLMAATRGAAGVGINTAENYLYARGDVLAGPTTYGVIQALKSLSATTPAGSDGDALTGSATAGTGHGVRASADVSSPASSALAIEPQDTDPSAPANGDVYVNSGSDHIAHYSALTVPARFQNLDPVIKVLLADSLAISDADAAEHVFSTAGPVEIFGLIPGNSLRIGSVIRLRAAGFYDDVGGAADFAVIRVRLGDASAGTGVILTSHQWGAVNLDRDWCLDLHAIIRDNDATGAIAASSMFMFGNQAHDAQVTLNAAVDFTADLEIFVSAQFNAGGAVGHDIDMGSFIAEVQ
jgi:hypothetical protein